MSDRDRGIIGGICDHEGVNFEGRWRPETTRGVKQCPLRTPTPTPTHTDSHPTDGGCAGCYCDDRSTKLTCETLKTMNSAVIELPAPLVYGSGAVVVVLLISAVVAVKIAIDRGRS